MAIGAIWANIWDETIWNTDIWDSNTPAANSPDQFSFVDQIGVTEGTLDVTSNSITISGLGTTGTASFTEHGHTTGEYRKNGGAWTDLGDVSVVNTDTLELRLDASASYLTVHGITVTIGNTSDRWDVTTRGDPNAVATSRPKVTITVSGGMTI